MIGSHWVRADCGLAGAEELLMDCAAVTLFTEACCPARPLCPSKSPKTSAMNAQLIRAIVFPRTRLAFYSELFGRLFPKDRYMPPDNEFQTGRRSALVIAAGGALALAGCNPVARAPLPETVNLPSIAGLKTAMGSPLPGLSGAVFRRGPVVLNVWASWCPYCQGEHDTLMALARDPNLMLLGIVFRDKPEAAAAYLRKAGNPYRALGLDQNQWVSKNLRQSGVPTTYVVDGAGKILEVLVGGLSPDRVETSLRPAYERAKALV